MAKAMTKVLFHDIVGGRWLPVLVGNDSNVLEALAGKEGDEFDILRERYKHISEETDESTEDEDTSPDPVEKVEAHQPAERVPPRPFIEGPVMKPQEVNVVHETGERLVVTRESNIINELRPTAIWPEDEPSQRMWALSAVLQAPGIRFKDEDDLDDKLTEAQRIMDWVNGRESDV